MAQTSPFKFLDPDEKADKNSFFGRADETEDLYQLSFRTNLLLVYGASGTGKTSIMKCRLANRFSPTSWQELYILRMGDHLLQTLRREVQAQLEAVAYDGYQMTDDIAEALGQLYRFTATPVYLILDQFEEVLISGSEEERKSFFRFLNRIVAPESNLNCKAILIMREEFIASCWNYERLVPALFENRYRIERMHAESKAIRDVISGTLQNLPEVEIAPGTTEAIIKGLQVGKAGLELTYLQVYLDRLYRQAQQQSEQDQLRFSPDLVDSLGKIEDVIGEFLDEQLRELEATLGPGRAGVPLQLLSAFVTDDRTKRIATEEALQSLKEEHQITDEEFQLCLDTFDRMQIIRKYED